MVVYRRPVLYQFVSRGYMVLLLYGVNVVLFILTRNCLSSVQ